MFLFSSFRTFHFLSDISLIYHLEHIWLSELWSLQSLFFTLSLIYMATRVNIKVSQENKINRELCKWSFSLHNPETTGNPLTLNSSTALLWNSSTQREICWCLTHNKFATSWYWGRNKEEEQSADQANVHPEDILKKMSVFQRAEGSFRPTSCPFCPSPPLPPLEHTENALSCREHLYMVERGQTFTHIISSMRI